jgi:DNA repair exonuclease SbcCD ATPase subunit
LKEQVEGLRELRNFLAHVSLRAVSSSAKISDLQEIVKSESQQLQDRLQDLQKQAGALEQTIADLEKKRAEYVALQSRLQSLGYTSLEGARRALVDLEVRSLSLRAAKQAVQDTLAVQRNIDLKEVYSQIARVWETFVGREGWNLQLDGKGMPVLSDGKGREFDLSQFSGGEKTVLLVILHTIIARHFSRSDFLLIDEPLEHLDAVNRRSLIRFLTGAYQRESFNQLIITTFEESLTRKYMSDEGISFVHL